MSTSVRNVPQPSGARVFSVGSAPSAPVSRAERRRKSGRRQQGRKYLENDDNGAGDGVWSGRIELLEGFFAGDREADATGKVGDAMGGSGGGGSGGSGAGKNIKATKTMSGQMHCVELSANGQTLLCAGEYPPSVAVLNLAEMGTKLRRRVGSPVRRIAPLSLSGSDRFALLLADRQIDVHTDAGPVASVRLPSFCRDMILDEYNAELWAGGSGADIFRLSLDLGRFVSPLSLASSAPDPLAPAGGAGAVGGAGTAARENSINCMDICGVQGLVACGTETGVVEFFDPRAPAEMSEAKRKRSQSIAILDCLATPDRSFGGSAGATLRDAELSGDFTSSGFNEVTALRFDLDGLTLGAGLASGHVLLYDLRKRMPWIVKDHQYGFPIRHISFPRSVGDGGGNCRRVLSADTQVIKIWDTASAGAGLDAGLPGPGFDGDDSASRSAAETWVNIEPGCQINDVAPVADSGLIFAVGEQPRGLIYYLPELGPAPAWCTFLENVTEELEESHVSAQAIYDDFTFVPREEAEQLNLLNMAAAADSGSGSLIKPYLHGFFVDARLYQKARAMSQPFEFQNFRKEQIQKRLAEKAGNRVSSKAVLENALARQRHAVNPEVALKTPGVASDDRFAAMFEDEDFKVEKTSERYQQIYSTQEKADAQRDRARLSVMQDLETADSHSSRTALASEFLPTDQNTNVDYGSDFGAESAESSSEEEEAAPQQPERTAPGRRKGPKMLEIHDKNSWSRDAGDVAQMRDMTFADRLAMQQRGGNRSGSGAAVAMGDAELTFSSEAQTQERAENRRKRQEQRERSQHKRGVRELGLPKMRVQGGFRPRR